MRSPSIIYTLVILLIAVFTSCNKVDAVIQSGAASLSEQDAAEILANALLPAYGGLLSQAEQAVAITRRSAGACGISKDSLIKASLAPANIPVSCNYQLAWNYSATCPANRVNISFNGTVSYDGPHFSATINKSAGGYVSGMEATQTAYLFIAKVNSEGNAVKKSVGSTPIKGHFELESNSLQFDKTSGQLLAGGEVKLSIRDASGAAFAYAGKFTTTGSRKGTIILNSGTTYPITW